MFYLHRYPYFSQFFNVTLLWQTNQNQTTWRGQFSRIFKIFLLHSGREVLWRHLRCTKENERHFDLYVQSDNFFIFSEKLKYKKHGFSFFQRYEKLKIHQFNLLQGKNAQTHTQIQVFEIHTQVQQASIPFFMTS